MIKKIKVLLANLSIASLLLVPILAPVAVHAQISDDPNLQDNLCSGAEELQFGTTGTCSDTTGAEDTVNSLVGTVINIFSVVVGIIAVIMIIYGGFKYITSGGDSGNIGSAKNTILFAIVGLIIVAMAQIVVRFVLSRAVGDGETAV
ncbi:MAG TPA: pilin [Candidatus Limnocylindria bacterium]|nr:pilin [Candidatus Limnocylindria bacterium]